VKAPLFPCVLTALDLCAAVEAACRRDARMACYWLAAATLTVCVLLGAK